MLCILKKENNNLFGSICLRSIQELHVFLPISPWKVRYLVLHKELLPIRVELCTCSWIALCQSLWVFLVCFLVAVTLTGWREGGLQGPSAHPTFFIFLKTKCLYIIFVKKYFDFNRNTKIFIFTLCLNSESIVRSCNEKLCSPVNE